MRQHWVVLPTGRLDDALRLRERVLPIFEGLGRDWDKPASARELMTPQEVDGRTARQLVPSNCSADATSWLLLVDKKEKNLLDVLVLPGLPELIDELQHCAYLGTLEQIHGHFVGNARAAGGSRSGVARIRLPEEVDIFLRKQEKGVLPPTPKAPGQAATRISKRVARHLDTMRKSEEKLVLALLKVRGDDERTTSIFSRAMATRHNAERRLLASFSAPDLHRELGLIGKRPLLDLAGLHPSSHEMLRTAMLVKEVLDKLEPDADYSAVAGFWKALEMECNRCVVDGARAARKVCRFGTAENAVPRCKSTICAWNAKLPKAYTIALHEEKGAGGLKDLTLGQVHDLLDASDPMVVMSPAKHNNPLRRELRPPLAGGSWDFIFQQEHLRQVIVKVYKVRNRAAHTGIISGRDAEPVLKVLMDTGPTGPFPQLVDAKQKLGSFPF